MFFHPNVPRYRRGVVLLSAFTCTLVGVHVVMGDFGTQKHIFTGVQAHITPVVDKFFGVTPSELTARRAARVAALSSPTTTPAATAA